MLTRYRWLIAAVLLLPGSARAATFNIANGDVAGLISALNTAQTNNEADTVNLAAGGTYTLTAVDNTVDGPNGLPVINDDVAGQDLTLDGHGATLQRATGGTSFRIATVDNGASATIKSLTLAHGKASGAFPGSAGGIIFNAGGDLTMQNCTLANSTAEFGGGLYNDHGTVALANCTVRGNSVGTFGGGIASAGGSAFGSASLTLTNCTLSGNSAGGGGGGGIDSDGGNSGSATLHLTNCTLRQNSAGNGGGIVSNGAGGNASAVLDGCTLDRNTATGNGGGILSSGGNTGGSATLALTNCTLSGNAATSIGGGIFSTGEGSGGFSSQASLSLSHCTFSQNSAPDGGDSIYNDAFGGGDATLTLDNTILQVNAAGSNIANSAGTVNSLGYNLSNDNGGGFLTALGDQPNVANVGLDAAGLQDNGGLTPTIALQAGSPALDQGKAFGLATDQRGRARPFDDPGIANASGGDGSDIGAFERVVVGLRVSDVTVTEGNSGTASVLFKVTLAAPSSQTVTVHCATSNGTAIAPDDYTAVPDTVLTFTPGQVSKTVPVAIKGDTLDEANETFKVLLSSPANATIIDGLGVGTITDNDPTPHFLISDVTVTEGDAGTVAANFNLSLSAASNRTVTVTYKTADGTAMAPADYVAHPSTTLTYTPGQISKTITVQVNGDTIDEGNETFKVVLQSATFAAIVDDKGAGTISDDDPLPSLSISDAPALNEGNSGSHNALFVVTLTGATGRTVTVNYVTANATATAGSDYTAASGTITFLPGQTSKTLPIQVNGDTTVEPDKTFKVILMGATFATISDAQGSHTILDDDASE